MLTTTAAAFAFTASPSTRPSVACRADPQMCGILATVNSKLSPESLRLQTLTLQRVRVHHPPRVRACALVLSLRAY